MSAVATIIRQAASKYTDEVVQEEQITRLEDIATRIAELGSLWHGVSI